MKTPFSPNAALAFNPFLKVGRDFRAERVPAPRVLASSTDPVFVQAKVEWARRHGHPIDLEIGCGVGWHPLVYAAENPDRLLFAVEQTAEKFAKFRERLAHHPRRENLVAVHADAIAWIVHAASELEFNRMLILYPNPNPKNASARWIRMPFFGFLLARLAPGGTIHFRTNSADYATEVRQFAVSQWGLGIIDSRELTRDAGAQPITHFERKYLERGEICQEIILGRGAKNPASPVPEKRS